MHCGSTATADAFVPVARSGRRELPGAGDNAAFVWPFNTKTYPKAAFTTRLADDQELDWEVGPGLRHRKHTIRDRQRSPALYGRSIGGTREAYRRYMRGCRIPELGQRS